VSNVFRVSHSHSAFFYAIFLLLFAAINDVFHRTENIILDGGNSVPVRNIFLLIFLQANEWGRGPLNKFPFFPHIYSICSAVWSVWNLFSKKICLIYIFFFDRLFITNLNWGKFLGMKSYDLEFRFQTKWSPLLIQSLFVMAKQNNVMDKINKQDSQIGDSCSN